MVTQHLPPDTEQHSDGTYWRTILFEGLDGRPRKRIRPVNITSLEDARSKREDFYHNTLGWIIEGVSREKEYDDEGVMADDSMGIAIDPDKTAQNRTITNVPLGDNK